jgi:hypothetical protein
VNRAAVLSDDGRYRYHLSRWWESRGPVMNFLMLNPSTADADVDDPTIRRCISFARREGCFAVNVANLFALRATDPAVMASDPGRVGPENDQWLERYLDVAQVDGCFLVAAWGSHKIARDRAAIVAERARLRGVIVHCLGKTADGSPRHPLYVKGDQPLEVWS